MGGDDFQSLVDCRVENSGGETAVDPAVRDSLMFEYRHRRSVFESSMRRFIQEIVGPRLDYLVSHFTHAQWEFADQGLSCRASFGYCERFPVSANLEFNAVHNPGCTEFEVRYSARFVPSFFDYVRGDVLEIEKPFDDESAGFVKDREPWWFPAGRQWTEKRMLEFLDCYLRYDRGPDYSNEDLATDPVCGMRVKRSDSIQRNYRGHSYFFCSEQCAHDFLRSPERYVKFELP